MASDPIGEIQRAIITFNRNTRNQAAKMVSGGSLVSAPILAYVDASEDPTATDLALLWGLDKSTVSRQLGELEEKGLLRREPHETRPRTQQLKLTAKGKKALTTAITKHREALEQTLASWSPADVETFSVLLARFVAD
ncbi:MAG: MarR family winged helix-turn-helix transcriptional regulator [Kofleriaceae bacterium]